MKTDMKTLLTALTAGTALAAGSAQASTVVLIDWSAVATVSNPAGDGKHWNSLGPGGIGDAGDFTDNSIIDSAGNTVSGFTVQVDNTGVSSNFTGAGFGGTAIAGPTGADPFDETNAVNDGLYANYNANGTSVITLSGLSGSTQYDFAAIGGRASGGNDGIIEVLQGTSGSSTYTLQNSGAILNFSVTSTAGGVIQFDFSEIVDDIDGGSSAVWKAVSISSNDPVVIPTPTASGLALVGLAGLVVRKRRRR